MRCKAPKLLIPTLLLLAATPSGAVSCEKATAAAAARESLLAGQAEAALERLGTPEDWSCFFRLTDGDSASNAKSLEDFGEAVLAASEKAPDDDPKLLLLEYAELALRRSLGRSNEGPGVLLLIECLMRQITQHERWYLTGEVHSRIAGFLKADAEDTPEAEWAKKIRQQLEALPEDSKPFERGADRQAPAQPGGDVSRPSKLEARQPQYTERARQARAQGTVIVQAIINTEGLIEATRIIRGLPLGLSEAALDAISAWRFEPATLNGTPVPVYYNLSVNFRLK